MIRIIFDDGELIECDHISKIYMEESDHDKVTIVGNINLCRPQDDLVIDMEGEY